jgi:hypothetical protein
MRGLMAARAKTYNMLHAIGRQQPRLTLQVGDNMRALRAAGLAGKAIPL